jgi:hypothetical protein
MRGTGDAGTDDYTTFEPEDMMSAQSTREWNAFLHDLAATKVLLAADVVGADGVDSREIASVPD